MVDGGGHHHADVDDPAVLAHLLGQGVRTGRDTVRRPGACRGTGPPRRRARNRCARPGSWRCPRSRGPAPAPRHGGWRRPPRRPAARPRARRAHCAAAARGARESGCLPAPWESGGPACPPACPTAKARGRSSSPLQPPSPPASTPAALPARSQGRSAAPLRSSSSTSILSLAIAVTSFIFVADEGDAVALVLPGPPVSYTTSWDSTGWRPYGVQPSGRGLPGSPWRAHLGLHGAVACVCDYEYNVAGICTLEPSCLRSRMRFVPRTMWRRRRGPRCRPDREAPGELRWRHRHSL